MKAGTIAVRIEPIGLDNKGYGKDGTLTRREWQKECIKALMSGPENFSSWQNELANYAPKQTMVRVPPCFDFEVSYEDKNTPPTTIGWSGPPNTSHFVLDLVGLTLSDFPNFSQYTFHFGMNLSGAIFEDQPHFSNSAFVGDLFCWGTNFKYGATFSDTEFKHGAIFSHSTFGGLAFFYRTIFSTVASFDSVHFVRQAYFQDAKIHMLSCRGASFDGEANFDAYIPIDVRNPQTIGKTDFSGTIFNRSINFSNREFTGALIFGDYLNRQSEFKVAPLFHNCKLHQDTSFSDCIFPKNNRGDKHAKLAYNTLRLAMGQKQATQEEQRFLRLELDSERLRSNWRVGFLYDIYKIFANYGFSIKRPIILLVVIPFFLSIAFYGLLASDVACLTVSSNQCSFEDPLAAKAIQLSFIQALPPLGLEKFAEQLRTELSPDQSSSTALVFTVAIAMQKFLAIFGWFFAALALRNQFKMK